ncbi:MAG TPA: LppP/LprE family lipoprotein [Solirubrobacteraceae bacterium]|nr:LppP/LprE family lipoprotein [Solirubrobacteraceae bacterium]
MSVRAVIWALSLLAMPLLVLALSGCGEATKTVSIANTPTPTSSSSTSSTSASTTTAATTTGALTSTTASSTRTQSAPAFTHPTGSSGSGAAAAVLRAHGFTANDTSQYHPNQTLGVLVGTRTGSGDGYGQQAFFFVGGRYIGTDSTQSSATLRVVSQSDTQVTLAYPLYRSHDALCCPSGGEARVTFELNNGKLTPLQPIPPSSSQTGLSRQ